MPIVWHRKGCASAGIQLSSIRVYASNPLIPQIMLRIMLHSLLRLLADNGHRFEEHWRQPAMSRCFADEKWRWRGQMQESGARACQKTFQHSSKTKTFLFRPSMSGCISRSCLQELLRPVWSATFNKSGVFMQDHSCCSGGQHFSTECCSGISWTAAGASAAAAST